MPISKEEFLENMYQAFLKTDALNALNAARRAEEEALVQEYKVLELNGKRAALVEKYRALTTPLMEEITDLKSNISPSADAVEG